MKDDFWVFSIAEVVLNHRGNRRKQMRGKRESSDLQLCKSIKSFLYIYLGTWEISAVTY